MTPVLIRAELHDGGHPDDPWVEGDRDALVIIDDQTYTIPCALIVTPDDPVTPAMVEAWNIVPRPCAQTDWTAMLTALLEPDNG